MSAPTLTDLVDDALAVLAPGVRLATLYHHPQVAALYAALPRYEAALELAEAKVARDDAWRAWALAYDPPDAPALSQEQERTRASEAYDAACAAYRGARS